MMGRNVVGWFKLVVEGSLIVRGDVFFLNVI